MENLSLDVASMVQQELKGQKCGSKNCTNIVVKRENPLSGINRTSFCVQL